jgi:mono/diheme cytochrome c family protein
MFQPRRPSSPRPPLRGGAGLGLLFVLAGLALFALPFLRERDSIGVLAGDFGRNLETDFPFDADVAEYEQERGSGIAQAIAESSERYFGLESAWLRDSGAVEPLRLPSGRQNYEIHCVGCHAPNGDGGGPAARFLNPRPRNFRRGLFKFTSTPAGARPQRRDLFQTITRGLAGSAMPEFRLVNEEKRWDLVEYVRWLAMKGEFEELMLSGAWEDEELPDAAEMADLVLSRWLPARLATVYPGCAEPPNDAASVERGRAIFNDPAKASCFTCHGPEGRGDGVTADSYADDWGYPIRPRDLTAGTFRAGSTGDDLYRTIATGIKGTPMGSFEGALAPADIWDVVHFIQSLAPRQ